MNALWLILGLLLGAVAVAGALAPRIKRLSADAARASELDRELVRAQADLTHERSLAAERLKTLSDAQDQLSANFKALSAEALHAGMAQLTELARGHLLATQAQATGELEKRQQAVEQLVAPLKDQLGRVDAQLVSLDQERRESRGRLEAQLRTLTETGEKLRTETGALVTALRKPNARGQWGQMQLRNVVELAGMVRHCDFLEQASLSGEEALRPDAIVRMPGGKHVMIDAKAPLQGVLDAYQAREEDERQGHLRDHARLLRKHVRALADKGYWDQLGSAPDFVVMFLPGEHLYGAALEADPSLIEEAMARRVLIATPTTLLAILRAVAYGWQQERVAESAQAISELGRELHGRLVKLAGLLAKLGVRLNSTVRAYNEAVGSYEARVLPGARRFVEHGVGSAGGELHSFEQVTVSARTVIADDQSAATDGEGSQTSPADDTSTVHPLRAAG
ncbi:MAG: DNA recombination protein RmuC [Solirubrobacterales bacterium]|nr:DNA recombination protein RmuC [Solirubrobacterales bacterium]MBV9168037.1 DNA recombination protein RmuC [Solirubrobacterales bacterium]MBV9534620.1 DNA recombination protein RmuC [Solirubrobacterales bacterium]